jgi:hypothetical protein
MKWGCFVGCFFWLSPVVSQAADTFKNHSDFYIQVQLTENLSDVFERDPTAEVGRPVKALTGSGLGPLGKVRIQRDSLVIGGKRYLLAAAKRMSGPPDPITFDLELLQIWSQFVLKRDEPARMCFQSPVGRNGSAARWQHVVVVEQAQMPTTAKPKLYAWTSPYGTCEAVFVDQKNRLVVGAFEMSFESANHINSARFDLRPVQSGLTTARYELTLKNPGNAFVFSSKKLPATQPIR